VLSDADIELRFHEIFPMERSHNHSIDRDLQIQPASVDLRLGDTFMVYPRDGIPQNVYTNEIVDGLMEPLTLPPDSSGFTLFPGSQYFCLATTMEYVALPIDLVARVDGRSSLGRLGLRVHSTAGFIDPGFQGCITLEMDVVGRNPIVLNPGMRVCQISFDRLDTPSRRPYGPARGSKYQGQTTTTPSRIGEDK